MGLGFTICKLRTDSGKTQQQIAEMLNIDRRTYAKWEEESTEVKSSLIPKIAEIFEIDIKDLFKDDRKVDIKDSFKDNKNSNNAVIIMITEKEIVDKVLNLLSKD